MNSYVDYEFYTQSFHGELSQKEFDASVIKATAHVRRITFGRADFYNGGDEVKYATCAVCDLVQADEDRRKKHNGMNITSENTDGYSVAFASEQQVGESVEELLNKKVYKVAELFLMPTGLLNWSVCDDYKY